MGREKRTKAHPEVSHKARDFIVFVLLVKFKDDHQRGNIEVGRVVYRLRKATCVILKDPWRKVEFIEREKGMFKMFLVGPGKRSLLNFPFQLSFCLYCVSL